MSKHLSSWAIWLGILVVVSSCGGEDPAPLVCPAGSTPRMGECVPDAADGAVTDARVVPDGDVMDDGGVGDVGCVPMAGTDEPDPEGIDSDCDGIDGDADASVFVTPSGSDESSGDMEAPVATLERALEVAEMSGRDAVLIADGTYEGSIELSPGVSLHGGYEADGSWDRDSSTRPTLRGTGPVIRGTDIEVTTVVSTLRVEALDAMPGDSSIAVLLVRSSGVRLEDLEIFAGRGGDGAPGDSPEAGMVGMPGGMGSTGVVSGPCAGATMTLPSGGARALPACGCGGGGRGGRAGGFSDAMGTTTAGPGEAGSSRDPVMFGMMRLCPGGFGGGTGGTAGVAGSSGMRGGDGADGPTGADGAAGRGSFADSGYAVADGATGVTGQPGDGGGGGGGGDGCQIGEFCLRSGGTGGGGGSGGCGGAPGTGGGGGGGSIALYLWDSSPVLRRVSIRSSEGGAGGAGGVGAGGGPGGPGGPGGLGGACDSGMSGRGGDGGPGGHGGDGGDGAGGGGGPSVGILLGGSSVEGAGSSAVTIAVAAGGAGGAGGGTAPAGEPGASSQTLVP